MKRLILVGVLLFSFSVMAQPKRVTFQSDNVGHLTIEILRDDLLHIEYAPDALSQTASTQSQQRLQGIPHTPFVVSQNFPGASVFEDKAQGFFTKELDVSVNPETLCLHIQDKLRAYSIATLCPQNIGETVQYLSLAVDQMTHAYGLGQNFSETQAPCNLDRANGDWVSQGTCKRGPFGNSFTEFDNGIGNGGGKMGNIQIPVLYGLGKGYENFGIYIDTIYKQEWSFAPHEWTASIEDDKAFSFYVFSGDNLQDLRRDYMDLTGYPTMIPRQSFGYALSEYGFESWDELDEKLAFLQKDGFPVDMIILDNQWFGGFREATGSCEVGALTFDEKHFPNAKAKIQEYLNKGLFPIYIEEPIVCEKVYNEDPVVASLMVRDQNGNIYCTEDHPWWGFGGALDWSTQENRDTWHEYKRQDILDMGFKGVWTDLGEPEIFAADGVYKGVKHHKDIHNLHNFYWNQSIVEGMERNGMQQRPFILTRSGGPGSQRYGTAMWSGDIGASMSSMAYHFLAQVHMSLSGIDYYGSDVGGFWRMWDKMPEESLPYQELYTQWYANSAWTDIPLRPHAFNKDNEFHTTPNRVGDVIANKRATQTRYDLLPYYYTLAYRAHLNAEAIVAPMVYHFQDDPKLRTLGHQKMVGPWIMVSQVADHGASVKETYLPEGTWYDYYSGARVTPANDTRTVSTSLYADNGHFRLPVFVREGAIIPKQSQVIEGIEIDLFPSRTKTTFDLYEDDYTTVDYQSGAFMRHLFELEQKGDSVFFGIRYAGGMFAGAPETKTWLINLPTTSTRMERQNIRVLIDGKEFKKFLINDKTNTILLQGISVLGDVNIEFKNIS